MLTNEQRGASACDALTPQRSTTGDENRETQQPPLWRVWLERLRVMEAALSMTHDDVQDERIARLEATMAKLQERMAALS